MAGDQQENHAGLDESPEETQFAAVGGVAALGPIGHAVERSQRVHEQHGREKEGGQAIDFDLDGVTHQVPWQRQGGGGAAEAEAENAGHACQRSQPGEGERDALSGGRAALEEQAGNSAGGTDRGGDQHKHGGRGWIDGRHGAFLLAFRIRRGAGDGDGGFGGGESFKEYIAQFLALDGGLEFGAFEDVAEAGEKVEMRPHGWADEGEENIDGFAVDGLEIDGVFEEAKRNGGLGDVEDDGVADMGDGDAVADAGGAKGFAGEEDLMEEFAVDFFGQAHDLDHVAQDSRFFGAFDAVIDAAGFESVEEGGQLGIAGVGLGKSLDGDGDALGGGPFEDFGAVEAALLVDAIDGNAVLLDPSINGLIRHI